MERSGERWFNGESVCCLSMWVRVQSVSTPETRGCWGNESSGWESNCVRHQISILDLYAYCTLYTHTHIHTRLHAYMYMHITYMQKRTERQNTCFLQIWLIFCLVFWDRVSCSPGWLQTCQEWPWISDPPSPGITGMRHHGYLVIEPSNSCMLDKYSAS